MSEIKVGDRVVFKSWDEMEREYGLKGGAIDCPRTFTTSMQHLCGTEATVTSVVKGGEFVDLKDFSTEGDTDWSYSTAMLKKKEDESMSRFNVGDYLSKGSLRTVVTSENKDKPLTGYAKIGSQVTDTSIRRNTRYKVLTPSQRAKLGVAKGSDAFNETIKLLSGDVVFDSGNMDKSINYKGCEITFKSDRLIIKNMNTGRLHEITNLKGLIQIAEGVVLTGLDVIKAVEAPTPVAAAPPAPVATPTPANVTAFHKGDYIARKGKDRTLVYTDGETHADATLLGKVDTRTSHYRAEKYFKVMSAGQVRKMYPTLPLSDDMKSFLKDFGNDLVLYIANKNTFVFNGYSVVVDGDTLKVTKGSRNFELPTNVLIEINTGVSLIAQKFKALQATDKTALTTQPTTTTTAESKEDTTMKSTSMPAKNTISASMAIETLKSTLGGYLVQNETISLSPSGLAIHGRVYSKKEDALLNVAGTNVLSNIPVGFKVPTDIKDVNVEDILFDGDGKPVVIKEKKKMSKDNYRVTVIDPETEREQILYPTLDLFGNQVFDKLMTPFNYDMGCNPVLNIAAMSGLSYMDGGIEGVISKLTPQMFRLASQMEFKKLFNDRRFQLLAPAAVVAYTFLKQNKVDFSDFNIERFTSKFNIDKKTLAIALLVLALVIYFYKDDIAEKLLSEKIKGMPVIGFVAEPVASILMKLPSFKRKVSGAVEPSLE